MNQGRAENEFLVGFTKLLEAFELSRKPPGAAAFQGAEPLDPLEHTVRIHLRDELLALLGWQLGLGGDVAEEARIKDETTTYIDYLGVNPTTKVPALLWESKAWGKPFIAAGRKAVNFEKPADLLVRAIRHWLEDRSAKTSPAGAVWHGYVDQVAGYVRKLKADYDHIVPCAVISSGEWLVVFKKPLKTLVLGEVSAEDLEIYEFGDFIAAGRRIFRLLSREVLGPAVPYPLRPGQLGDYTTPDDAVAAFHSLHLHYDEGGTRHFSAKPRVTVYPAVTIVRRDGAILTAFEDDGAALEYPGGGDDAPPSLNEHLGRVDEAATALLAKCGQSVGKQLQPATLDQFPGFTDDNTAPLGAGRPNYVQAEAKPDLWLLVTGESRHFLRATPAVAVCPFHAWSLCRQTGQAIGDSAVSVRRTENPRSFFTDEEPHHCAHQGLNDLRDKRCQISGIDQRICCQACVYSVVCWKPDDKAGLPCGG